MKSHIDIKIKEEDLMLTTNINEIDVAPFSSSKKNYKNNNKHNIFDLNYKKKLNFIESKQKTSEKEYKLWCLLEELGPQKYFDVLHNYCLKNNISFNDKIKNQIMNRKNSVVDEMISFKSQILEYCDNMNASDSISDDKVLDSFNKPEFIKNFHTDIYINDKKNLIESLIKVFNTNKYYFEYIEQFNDLEKQVFWLIINKNFKLSFDIKKQLEEKLGLLKPIYLREKINLNTSYTTTLIKDLINQILKYFKISHHNDFAKELLTLSGIEDDNQKIYRMLTTYFISYSKDFVKFNKNIKPKKSELEFICLFLSNIPQIRIIFDNLKTYFLKDNCLLKSNQTQMRKKFDKGIKNIIKAIKNGKLPAKGVDLKMSQHKMSKFIPTHRSALFWNNMFMRLSKWLKFGFIK